MGERKTKIIVTVGAMHCSDETLRQFIENGADVLRTNMSHRTHQWHESLINRARKIINESGRDVKIEADISGPKVRTGDNPRDRYFIDIVEGENVTLTTGNPEDGKIHLPFPGIHSMVGKGSVIYIDDATVQLRVLEKNGNDICCQSLLNCKLGGNRTVVVPGKDFGLPTITEKDWKDMKFISKHDVDYFGLSLVKNAGEVEMAREFFSSQNNGIKIISKIETPEGVRNFDEILKASDAIMVARGDMGVFLPVEKVPFIQHEIVKKCRQAGKFVIVATDMLNSMKMNPTPTRAEVNDIYTAVSIGSDAVMLSGETTEGKYPIRCLEYMRRVVEEAETNPIKFLPGLTA